eukprot:5033396-Alexandrium_andersonii.AAC.1
MQVSDAGWVWWVYDGPCGPQCMSKGGAKNLRAQAPTQTQTQTGRQTNRTHTDTHTHGLTRPPTNRQQTDRQRQTCQAVQRLCGRWWGCCHRPAGQGRA